MIKIADNYYAQNLEKNECYSCGKQFIVGLEDKEEIKKENLHCPFCGSTSTGWTSCTTDEILTEFNDYGLLGCSHIYMDKDELDPLETMLKEVLDRESDRISGKK